MSSTKSYINSENKYDRVITLIDMDCFYCQVEELNPEMKGRRSCKPIAVVQYNEWRGGGIIAVNYKARAAGVTRHMRGDEAKQICPEIELCKVPNVRGKADLTKYRDAGKDVARVLQSFTPLFERASIDEAYLDITDLVMAKLRDMNNDKYKLDPSKFGSTFAVGYETMGDFVQDLTTRCATNSDDDYPGLFENESEHERNAYKRSDIKLLIGAAIVNDIRAAVKEKTSFECSAGIAHNKILAKLTAGMNKPNKQTILPVRSIPELYATLPITKVKGLGGKFGEEVCEAFKIKLMSQLTEIPKAELLKKFDEKNGYLLKFCCLVIDSFCFFIFYFSMWLHLISKGVDLEHVTPRYNSKSIGCCKRFPGKTAIMGIASLNHWLLELATEICERMEKDTLENNRKAKQMVVSYSQQIGNEDISSSRTTSLNYYEPEPIAREALEIIKRNTVQFFKGDNAGALNNPVKFLGISVSKFEDIPDTSKSEKLKELFQNHVKKSNLVSKPEETNANQISDEKNDVLQSTHSSTKTSLEEIMNRKKRSSSIENIKNTLEPAPVQKSKSLLETMFTNQKKLTVESNITIENPDTSITTSTEDNKENTKMGVQHSNNIAEYSDSELFDDKNLKDDEVMSKPNEEPISCDNESNPSIEHPVPSTSKQNITKPDSEDEEEDIFLEEVEIKLIRCDICQRKIPENELSVHNDFHFSLLISQQQREQFRNELKLKFSPQPNKSVPQEKKTKVSQKISSNKNNLPSIQTFLKKKTEELEENLVKCDECGKMVADIVEHADYHLAKKLQQEMNRSLNPGISTTGSKRKRSDSKSNKGNPVKVKPLTSFFIKPD
uniref:DNA polymerase eta n=1 Tax=Culicoides sonorensis TaxID=179676 RepID=A0A336MV37_CULSO